jgi:hypothetical protein
VITICLLSRQPNALLNDLNSTAVDSAQHPPAARRGSSKETMSVVRREVAALFAALVMGPAQGIAQQAVTLPAIPVRTLTAATSTDSGVVRSVMGIRALANGSVIVNDWLLRRLIMLDSTLKRVNILADTAPGAPNRYGSRPTGLLPFVSDSSIFLDNESQSMIVVDPTGTFGRVMAPPKVSDLSMMNTSSGGFDEKGRVVYRVPRRSAGPPQPMPRPTDATGKPTITLGMDSAAIVRADFDTRSVDTIMMLKIPVSKSMMVQMQPGSFYSTSVFNPLPQTDDWALLPDGTIAVVRGQDYHIDWLSKDGKLTSTPKMPFDWKKITQEDKEHLIDSLKQAYDKAYEKRAADLAANPPTPSAGAGRGDAGGGHGGGTTMTMFSSSGGPGGLPPIMPGMPADFRMPFVTYEPSELPDYYPPVRAGMMRADREGNVWLLPSTSSLSQGSILSGPAAAQTSSLVYDVVGRDGVIKERVKLPPGRNIVAFAPNGVVYLQYAPAPGVIYLERARIARSGATTQ